MNNKCISKIIGSIRKEPVDAIHKKLWTHASPIEEVWKATAKIQDTMHLYFHRNVW